MSTLFQLISHEYRKYVFTRGFLLFLLIIPLSASFGFFASQLSDRAAPVRAFAVIDQTGKYIPAIDQALANSRAWRELSAWDDYAPSALDLDPEAGFPLDAAFAPGPRTAERRDAFAAAGGLSAALDAAKPYLVENAPDAPEARDRFVRVEVPAAITNAGDLDAQTAVLREYVRGERTLDGPEKMLFAGVIIPEVISQVDPVRFWTNNLLDPELRGYVDDALTDAVKAEAYASQGLDISIIRQIEQISVPVRLFKANAEGAEEAGGTEFAETFIPLGLAYVLFIMILSIGGMLLTSTVEEKSNKIIEVLLSSVSATQLMASKLIGLALVGMTIPAIFLSAGYAATEIFGSSAVAGSDTAVLIDAVKAALFESPLIPLFFFYFLVGYLLFASVYLAVGAMSNSIQDAQSFVGPLTILLILPAPFLQMVVQDPNGIIARILTWVPLYAPYAIMIRMSAEPPQWEIIGATIFLVTFVIVVVAMMGRIYRNGVLSSGGAPNLKQMRDLIRSGS